MYKHKKVLKMSKKVRDVLRVSCGHLWTESEATTEVAAEKSNLRAWTQARFCNKKGHLLRYPFYCKKRSARRGSNPRPPPWQGGAPPLSHSRIAYCVMSCVSHARYIIQYELTFVNKKIKKNKKNLQPIFLLINHTKKQIQNIHRN